MVHPIEPIDKLKPCGVTERTADQMMIISGFDPMLLFRLVDFDFISESCCPVNARTEQRIPQWDGDQETPDGAALRWEYVTIRYWCDLRTIRSTTLSRLEALADAGGNVIFLGEAPALVDGKPDDRARRLAGRVKRIPFQRHAILQELEEERDVDIRRETGERSDNLFYQLRQDGNGKWLFVCHVNRKRNNVSRPERLSVRIRGAYQVMVYDALSGTVRRQKA
ncbi:MAG: hypothetical protein ACLUOI_12615 [Eisenbergiella sp.]